MTVAGDLRGLPAFSLFAPVVLTVADLVWAYGSGGSFAVARLSGETRSTLYLSLTASSAALLGFVIAALAALLALPMERKAVAALEALGGWREITTMLGIAVAFLALTLGLSTVALAVDTHERALVWLELPVFAAAGTGFLALSLGGVSFALAVRAARHG